VDVPQIALLSAPQWVETGRSFQVAASASYAGGISAIEVGFNDQVQRVPLRGGKVESVVTNFVATGTPPSDIRVLAVSADGKQSPLRIQHVFVGTEPTRVTRPTPDFARRLKDVGYPFRADTYNNIDVPVIESTVPWWNVWFENNGPKPFDWAHKCNLQNIDYGVVVECFLALNPKVATSIFWEEWNPNAGPVDKFNHHLGVATDMPYSAWTPQMKQQLYVAVYYAWSWMKGELTSPFNGPALPLAPTNQVSLQDSEATYTVLSHDDAWNMYLATAAQSLAVELGGFVPWSIVKYDENDLAEFFDSREMFYASYGQLEVNGQTVDSISGYWALNLIPAPPTLNFQTMVTQDMIRPDPFRTIGRYLRWGIANVTHTGAVYPPVSGKLGDGGDALSAEAYWNYRGVPPSSAIIQGTVLHDPKDPSWKWPLTHWLIGCPSMSFFTQQLLRAVNIPVIADVGNVGQTPHTAPFFFTLGYTMSHGDDMYTRPMDDAEFPGEWLLIPFSTYEYWFYGGGILGPYGLVNVSRQAIYEVPQKSLPDYLVQAYCADLSQGKSHDQGSVAGYFVDTKYNVTVYSVQQLEASGLWTKLAARAAAKGLCGP
jgi:hypothetical protein